MGFQNQTHKHDYRVLVSRSARFSFVSFLVRCVGLAIWFALVCIGFALVLHWLCIGLHWFALFCTGFALVCIDLQRFCFGLHWFCIGFVLVYIGLHWFTFASHWFCIGLHWFWVVLGPRWWAQMDSSFLVRLVSRSAPGPPMTNELSVPDPPAPLGATRLGRISEPS